MRSTKVKLALSVASLCAVLGAAAPAAAADPGPGVTFWSGAFTGETVTYPAPGTGCTVLPFIAHAEYNNTDKTLRVYQTTDCSGWFYYFPANDIHNFLNFDARSFRLVD